MTKQFRAKGVNVMFFSLETLYGFSYEKDALHDLVPFLQFKKSEKDP